MAKHRVLTPDRFLAKFQGNEYLLRNYVKLWQDGIPINSKSIDVPGFKKLIEQSQWNRKDEFLEELLRVHDLCTDRGHEDLLAACRDSNYEPDPKGTLPVELLSLKVRTENEDTSILRMIDARCGKLKGSRSTGVRKVWQSRTSRPQRNA